MSECDAFKLIEEFIKKSSDYETMMNNTNSTNIDLPPTLLSLTSSESSSSSSSSFISSYLGINQFQKEIVTIIETPPETPEQLKPIQLPYNDDTPIQKPNRPYSYYVATNFHPLDLTVLTQESNLEETKLDETVTEIPVVKKRSKKIIDEQKRLSISLTDIKIDKMENTKKNHSIFRLSSKKCKSNQNNLNKQEVDFEEIDDDAFIKSSTNAFKRSFIFNSTMPARIGSKNKPSEQNQHHQPSKINRFFRNLFRMNEKQTNKDTELDTSQTNFKFSRLFSFRHHTNQNDLNKRCKLTVSESVKPRGSTSTSCRSNSTSTNDTACPLQLVVTDEQPSKIILPQISIENEFVLEQHSPKSSEATDLTESFNKTSSNDYLDILRDQFYSEVADRLKKIASCTNSSANFSQEKSSLSSIDFIDIPYIDDEEENDENLYSYTNSDFNFSDCSKLIKTDMSDLVIDENRLYEFINSPSYNQFDNLACEYLNRYDSVWNKIALLFELINRSVQLVKGSNQVINQFIIQKLKETAAGYIHTKYCDWIYKNGGWKSVPDIISLPRENNERIH